MSKIQDALTRLQKDGMAIRPGKSDPSKGAGLPKRREGVAGSRSGGGETVVVSGPAHHVDPHALWQAGLLAPLDESSPGSNEFRHIKRPILDYVARQRALGINNGNTVMVTSAMPRAGKSFFSMSLASSISRERETNVVLVDGDVAKSHISRQLGLADQPGLMGLLTDDALTIPDAVVKTDFNNILVLPAGQSQAQSSTEQLASERMSEVLDELSSKFANRIVIIDSPPLLVTSEAQALAAKVAQIVIVVESGKTTHYELEETIGLLNPEKAISVILNKSRSSKKKKTGGGEYGYYSY